MSLRILVQSVFLGVFLIGPSVPAGAGQVVVSVSGQSGAWEFVQGGLNASEPYGTGDQGAPTIVSARDGIAFTAGDSIQVRYLSGLVTAAVNDLGAFPYADANGETGVAPPNNSRDPVYGITPSYYMSPSTYPIYYVELVGTFATSTGAIVGEPFKIGDSATLVVPAGAAQLQLGVNDRGYSNNGGSFSIDVSGQSVPEPGSIVLAAIGVVLVSIGLLSRRARRPSGESRRGP